MLFYHTEKKLSIITFPKLNHLLNKKSEPISKCRQENKYLRYQLVSNWEKKIDLCGFK